MLIPFSPGHFSAYGMLFSDLRYDYVRSCFKPLNDAHFDELGAMFAVTCTPECYRSKVASSC